MIERCRAWQEGREKRDRKRDGEKDRKGQKGRVSATTFLNDWTMNAEQNMVKIFYLIKDRWK